MCKLCLIGFQHNNLLVNERFASLYIKTYCELWEEDNRGVCPCDGRTLTHTGLPLQRNASDKRTVDLSSAPAKRMGEGSKAAHIVFDSTYQSSDTFVAGCTIHRWGRLSLGRYIPHKL